MMMMMKIWTRRFSNGIRVKCHESGNLTPLKKGSQGQLLTMYVCGPTVYDMAHIGHARTYVQFDMIRRVLGSVFGYNVAFFMNITDVDDKILKKASETNRDWRELAKDFEEKYLADMDRLNVLRPTFSPHATDYIDEMIRHISKMIDSGVAYQGNESGSVYFDTKAYDDKISAMHKYGILNPVAMEEDHNIPNSSVHISEKSSPRDFALWKCDASAPEAQSWDSPWGRGRPGWHTECSAMIQTTAGVLSGNGRLDIHGGGIDLRFPHHENERVQSQSLLPCGCDSHSEPWVSHFLHTGHLHIKGRKMSKSLKNFITLEEMLNGSTEFAKVTPRQLRLLFLHFKYNTAFELTAKSIGEAINMDAFLNEFFQLCHDWKNDSGHWEASDMVILQSVFAYREEVKEALCNDFDFPAVLQLTRKLVNECKVYLSENKNCKKGVLSAAAFEIRFVLENHLGVHAYTTKNLSGESKTDNVIDEFVKFRWLVRSAALAKDYSPLLPACDNLRNVVFPSFDVRVNDKASANESSWIYAVGLLPTPPAANTGKTGAKKK